MRRLVFIPAFILFPVQQPDLARCAVTRACTGHEPAISSAQARTPAARDDAAAVTFEFRTGFWGNLHHFLYVLGRAANGEADASRSAVAGAPDDGAGFDLLEPARQRAWQDAVRFYQEGFSKLDAIFDDSLTRTTALLSRADDDAGIESLSIADGLTRTLRGVAPVYREVWWPRHQAACARRTEQLRDLLARYGDRVGESIAAAYRENWPDRPVEISMTAYANWAGAYSTDRYGGLIAFSCLSEGNAGMSGLEIVFHEAMHWWDDPSLRRLRRIAGDIGVSVPSDLTHAMIFYTAGHSVQAVVPSHTPYAEQAGIWNRGMGRFKAALDAHWLPWLRGEIAQEEALRGLLQAVAEGR